MHNHNNDDDIAPVQAPSFIGKIPKIRTKTEEETEELMCEAEVDADVNDTSQIADKSLITLNLDEDDSTVVLSEDDSAYASSSAAVSGNIFG